MSDPANTPMRGGVLATTAASFVVAYGVFLRCVFPNADPVHPTWYGWMLDEGRWTELAREWALFGAPDIDTGVSVMHLLVAPIYQLFSASAFEVLGVGFSSARIVSRVAGVLLLLLICVRLRRVLPPLGWVVTVGLVAVHPELVYFSRVAIPEMVALLFQTSAFLVLVLSPRSVGRAVAAGALTAIGLGAKATTAPVAIAFAVIILVVHSGDDLGSRLTRLGAFALGLVGPGLVLLATVVMLVGSPGEVLAGAGGVDQILSFVELKSVPQIAATPFRAGAATLNTLLVALWPVAIAAWLRRTTSPLKAPLFLASIIWAIGWMIPWALLSYFPERYVTHLYVPLILAIGSGLSSLEQGESRSLRELFDGLPPVRRLAVAGMAAVPLAVVAAPALLALVHPLDLGLDRIRYRAFLVCGLAIAAGTCFASRARWVPLHAAIVAFPLTVVLTWRLVHGPIPGQFWGVGTGEELILWPAIMVVAACLTWGIGRVSRGSVWQRQPLIYTAAYAVAICLVWSITDHAPTVGKSRYVLPAIAAEIADRYESQGQIGVAKSASALIETPFRHKEVFGPDDMPSVVLAASWGGILSQDPADLQPHRLVKEFEMPRFEYRGKVSPMPTYIRLYELSEPLGSLPDESNASDRPSGSDPGQ